MNLNGLDLCLSLLSTTLRCLFFWMKLGVTRGMRIGVTLIGGEGSLLVSISCWLGDSIHEC